MAGEPSKGDPHAGRPIEPAPDGDGRAIADRAAVEAPRRHAWVSRQFLRYLFCLAVTAGVGAADYLTGWEISFVPFYFIPILLAGILISGGAGFVLALACAVSWGIVDHCSGHPYQQGWVFYWNFGARFVTFMVVALLSSVFDILLDRHPAHTKSG